jgi:hypothetical protein
MADLRRVYDGKGKLEETKRSCEEAQRRKRVQLQAIQMGIAELGGQEIQVNVADFKKTDIQQILNELKFIDTSTATGASDAASAAGKFTPMFDCKMFIEGQEKPVKVFGRKV